jgi:hypothetical protein
MKKLIILIIFIPIFLSCQKEIKTVKQPIKTITQDCNCKIDIRKSVVNIYIFKKDGPEKPLKTELE